MTCWTWAQGKCHTDTWT